MRLHPRTLLTVLAVASLLAATRFFWPGRKFHRVPDPRLQCLQGVVTVVEGGRIGNHIFEYASAWSLAKHLGFKVMVSSKLVSVLKIVYVNLTAEILEWELATGDCKGTGLGKETVFASAVEKTEDFEAYVRWAVDNQQPIVLPVWSVLVEFIVLNFPSVLEEFKLHPYYVKHANEILDVVREDTQWIVGQKKVTFVGLHVRRTDYSTYLLEKLNVTTVADVDFYRKAVKKMRRLLRKKAEAVAIVVASDDPDWCTEYLETPLRQDLSKGQPPGEVSVISEGGPGVVGHDLSVLSLCNHSIFAYGTYGMWSALKAGGYTIAYNITNEYNEKITRNYPTMKIAKMLPNWTLL